MNRERNWHRLTQDELERVMRTDSARGLSEKEAQRRLRHGKNTVWEQKTASVKRYALRSFLDLTTVLLVLTVIASAFFGSTAACIAICIMLAVGRCARIGAHIYSERVFEKNASAALPRAKVVRGGTVKIVASDMIVPGDVIILDSGDTVPCDIRLTAADNILVTEGNVTGVDGIVSKNSNVVNEGGAGEVPIAMRSNIVFASSVVISGFAIGVAVATGDDTLICTREGRIVLKGENDVSTVEKLTDWGRICSLCLIAAAFVITVIGIIFGDEGISAYFIPSIAMAAAGLSEYIGAVGAFAWARQLRSEGGVITKASVAEKAANTQVLMIRSASVLRSGKTTLHSYYENGKLTMIGTKDAKAPAELLRLACYCTGASPEGSIVTGNLGTRRRAAGVLPYELVRSLQEENKSEDGGEKYTIVQHLPAKDTESGGLDSVLLALGNEFYYCAMGSVESVLSISAYRMDGENKVPLTAEDSREILAYAKELRRHGVTLAAVGKRSSHYNNLRRISVLQSNLTFEGFIAVADRPCDGVVESIEDFRASGGRMVIFSERGEEDKCYAEAEGVYKTGDTYLPLGESLNVKALSFDKGSLSMIETPSGTEGIRERLRFVKLARENELSVTYVGYGVEDMWSMRNANVAFATPTSTGMLPQGIRTEAHGVAESEGGGFKEVCMMIDNCRKALSNIRNILNYLIVSHVARLVLMIVCAAAGLSLPSAAALVFWGVVLDFAVAFASANAPGARIEYGLRSGSISATPDAKREVIIPTMYGALCATLAVVVPFLARSLLSFAGYETGVSREGLMICMVLSCVFAMPFIGAEFAGGYGLFSKKSKTGVFFVIPFAIAFLGGALILFVPGIREAFGADFAGWIMTAFTLAPGAVMVVVMSVVRAIKKK